MSIEADQWMGLSDDDLRRKTLTGTAGSVNFNAGVAEMNMR